MRVCDNVFASRPGDARCQRQDRGSNSNTHVRPYHLGIAGIMDTWDPPSIWQCYSTGFWDLKSALHAKRRPFMRCYIPGRPTEKYVTENLESRIDSEWWRSTRSNGK